ncbi:MAG: DUF4926 domain-containing protein [Deltaproteobacteria bacterium RBG_16_49_23]|nr:MAG: DUF4926 domain-containing protein [Deltaproteobacteria bacterium RBG_16_49_23]
MVQELDTVVLTHDISEYGLERGDIGAVVHCYKDNLTFEVEFVAADGKTIAVLTLHQADIRPISGREVLHTRELAEVVR